MYDAAKPIKWSIKVWMACCSKSAYAHNLEMYYGRDADFKDLSTVNNAAVVVLKLLQEFWEKWYYVYTDQYYASLNLLHWLHRLELSGTGTCMTNKKGFPKTLVKTNPESRRLD